MKDLGLLLLVGLGIGAYVFWNPTICGPLTNISGGRFNFCTLKSPHGRTPSQASERPGIIAHLESRQNTPHVHHSSDRHKTHPTITQRHLIKANAIKGIAPSGQVPAFNTPIQANFAEISHYRMSI